MIKTVLSRESLNAMIERRGLYRGAGDLLANSPSGDAGLNRLVSVMGVSVCAGEFLDAALYARYLITGRSAEISKRSVACASRTDRSASSGVSPRPKMKPR